MAVGERFVYLATELPVFYELLHGCCFAYASDTYQVNDYHTRLFIHFSIACGAIPYPDRANEPIAVVGFPSSGRVGSGDVARTLMIRFHLLLFGTIASCSAMCSIFQTSSSALVLSLWIDDPKTILSEYAATDSEWNGRR